MSLVDSIEDAARLYAVAWNTLEFQDLFDALDVDVHYASQYVWDEMENKEEIVAYLSGKAETIKQAGEPSTVRVELGELVRGATVNPRPGTKCAVLYQGPVAEIIGVAFFEVADGRIKRIDLCMPELTHSAANSIASFETRPDDIRTYQTARTCHTYRFLCCHRRLTPGEFDKTIVIVNLTQKDHAYRHEKPVLARPGLMQRSNFHQFKPVFLVRHNWDDSRSLIAH